MYTNPESLIGKVIEGYRLTRVLGAGATSTVFEAERVQPATGASAATGMGDTGADGAPATVAVKVLLPQYAGTNTDVKEATRRFLREARAAKKLTHPHILPVLSSGESDGVIYMILPLVAAGTLSTWLSTQTEPLPLRVVGDVLQQIAAGLDYAHSQGIIHRDIKPSNLLRAPDGTIYVSDFGVARLLSTEGGALVTTEIPDRTALTQTGEALGTPYYMAPEQIRGDAVSAASDEYALGIVLYLLVTGQVPFQGDTPLAVALEHLQEEPCPPHLLRTDLPEGVEEVMLKALAKEPDDRYTSAGELARAFNAQVALAAGDDAATLLILGPAAAQSDAHKSEHALVGETVGDYVVEAHLADDDVGSLFRARTAPSSQRYRLRVLGEGGASPTGGALSDADLRRYAEGAQTLLGLRHPGLLPVIDAGVARGMAYVVAPLPNGQTLAEVSTARGPLDLEKADSLLTQVAQLLDWAHGQNQLHGSLSPSNIYVDERGTVQVADLGLRQLRERVSAVSGTVGAGPGVEGSIKTPLLIDQFAASPEQVLGKPTERATDVYALGCLLFQMLAGRPAFDGATPEDIAQQHLYSTPPTLRRVRTGLPNALQNILNRALAKDPRQRYVKPSDLARAFHEIRTRAALSSSQSGAVPVTLGSRVSASLARGSAGGGSLSQTETAVRSRELLPEAAETQIASLPPTHHRAVEDVPTSPLDATTPSASSTIAAAPFAMTVAPSKPALPPMALAPSAPSAPPAQKPLQLTTAQDAPPPLPARPGNRPRRRFTASRVALVALTVVVLGCLGFVLVRALAPTPTATVSFADSTHSQPGLSDSVTVSAQALPDLANGSIYYAWILDESNETSQILGPLQKHGDTYSLQFSQQGVAPLSKLVGGADTVKLVVTAEPNAQVPVHWPRGNIVLAVTVPAASFVHVGHLLVAFPTTPGNAGLLVGLQNQAQRLDAQALALQDDVQKGNQTAYTCEAQSMIDIIEGSKGPSYAPLSADCINAGVTEAGDGFGILGASGYNAEVSDHANLAASAPGATDATKTHAHNIAIAIANIDAWATNADHAAWWLLHHPNDTSGVTTLVTDALETFEGHNPSGNGIAPPLAGEAGAQTAYREGQLMATLTLTQATS